MATSVVLATLLLLVELATPQVATLKPDAPSNESTTAEIPVSKGHVYLNKERLTEGVISSALELSTQEAVSATTIDPSAVMTSPNEPFVLTSTSDLINGKGRPVPVADPLEPPDATAVCQSLSDQSIDLQCSLPRAVLHITGQQGSYVRITCQSGTEFSCEELPVLPVGHNQPIRVELQYCVPLPRPACLAPRLQANLTHLYLKYPPSDVTVSVHTLDGLDELEEFSVYGDGVDTYKMDFPREAFSSRPALRSLTINNIKLSLQGHDLDGTTGLETLELSNVGLTSLPAAIFARLNKLQNLYIWKNQLKELREEDLEGLTSLLKLDVSRNALTSLAPLTARARLPELTTLSVMGNSIEVLPPLASLNNLNKLDLFANKIPLTIAAGALAALPNLTEVNLQGNFITQLPEDMFYDTSALRILNLRNNDLKELPPNLFRDLKALKELDLSSNKLTALRPEGFQALKSLVKLNLNNNRITTFPSRMLFGACALTQLWVSRNEVRELGAGSMTCGGRDRLEDIDLSHNRLVGLTPLDQTQYSDLTSVFAAYADSLHTLDLSHNQLAKPPDDVHSFIYLRRLDLSHNNLTHLLPHDLSFFSSQAEVDYRYNNISLILLSPGTPPGSKPAAAAWAQDHSRSMVQVEGNPFHCDCQLYYFATRLHGYVAYDTTESRVDVGDAACASPPALRGTALPAVALEDLVCTSADVPDIPCAPNCSCIYRAHTNAVELTCPTPPQKPNTSQLPHVHLELTLTQPNFAPIPYEIRVLNLSALALTSVPENLPPGLRLLDLSNNQLLEIPKDLLQSDIKLRLAGNEFQCDCSHRNALRLLKEFWHNIEDGTDIKCSNGMPFTDISVEALCSTRTAILIGVPLALIGVLTAIIAIIFMRYSLEIRVWLHAKGLFTHWQAIDDENRTYDAFISFCHKDEAFITEQLVPGLEKGSGGPYKLCVHYRDWIPGEWIPAQIARSVADSRRTIIVVSKNFLDSLWGRAEFRTANMSAIKERQTRVIVILLEDISSHKELDPELKAYLSTNTYLKWGDPWFWEKLRYALPHRRQTNQLNMAAKVKKRDRCKDSAEGEKGMKRVTGLPEVLSPAGLLVPSAVPPSFVNKCEQFDIEIGNLKGMDIADLKEIKAVS